MEPRELLNKHCEFNNPYDCYVLLAVSRKKDTPELTNSQEIVFREVIKHIKDIDRKYKRIKLNCQNYRDDNGKAYPFYIYISLNARNAKKANILMMNKLLLWLEEESNGVDRSKMFKKMAGNFYSHLMKPESRTKSQKYFMIDYDEKDKIDEFKKLLKDITETNIILEQETKNGYHLKIKPFNRNELVGFSDFDYEVKTDANFFVEYVEGKNGNKI